MYHPSSMYSKNITNFLFKWGNPPSKLEICWLKHSDPTFAQYLIELGPEFSTIWWFPTKSRTPNIRLIPQSDFQQSAARPSFQMNQFRLKEFPSVKRSISPKLLQKSAPRRPASFARSLHSVLGSPQLRLSTANSLEDY